MTAATTLAATIMDDGQSLVYAILAALVAIHIIRWRSNPVRISEHHHTGVAAKTFTVVLQLNSIPTMGGPSAPILSYISAYNFLHNAKDILAEGYQKVCPSAFPR